MSPVVVPSPEPPRASREEFLAVYNSFQVSFALLDELYAKLNAPLGSVVEAYGIDLDILVPRRNFMRPAQKSAA